MQIALPHAHYSDAYLEVVKAEMRTLGAPAIKAVWMECWGIWVALEGTHRIRAAKALGLEPQIVAVEYNDELVDGLEDECKISDWCDAVLTENRPTLTF